MTAGIYDFTIEQGTDFSKTLTWQNPDGTPINLTGWTAACQIRSRAGVLIVDFLISGSIVINGTAGTVTLTLPNSVTTGLKFDTAKYDIKLTTSLSSKERLVQGIVRLSLQETV